ncbi:MULTISPECIES: hypothetical protein [Mangrovimonas]|uniref:hypothetical protein n=1 Tax=Mangrovimonas TaxID=1211036 RepID=UPI0006B490C4|nr:MULTISPECIES: hypothetical protein [Mangrovimonas]OMP31970.1 hypothetical protein BKM32_02625 [Mangrovimonas sp. DI 80]
MGLHKILRILVAILSVLGVIFLGRIIGEGDDAIKAAALEGDTAIVDPIAYIAYVVLGIILAFVVFFVLKNLVTHTASLKGTLIGVGLFAAILIVAYAVSGGDTTVYKYNNQVATETESHMAGAGLIAFYILIIAAAASMLLAGVKKMIK